MDKFLEMYNLPRPNHKVRGNLNRPIMAKEIKSVIKNFPANKRNQLASLVHSTKHLKKN